ncbi:MAG TPA: MFS transporter [Vicinamibacterales bacterium]|nr:MFS transporter [Vicinamibacterales bacterium]
MHLTDPAQTASIDMRREVVARVIRRLIPFAFICYVVAYIDRVNVSFAAAALQKDLGLNDAQFGHGAGLFFIGYCLFEVPSNLILERVGARRWIARILIGWGIVAMGMVFVRDVWTFYGARVLLGIGEAGFFPGIILYLTYWIPEADRARTGALFMMAAPVSIIIGAPISDRLLALDGFLGLHGWQWLFLLEGFPAIVLGVFALRALTDRPSGAHWLTDSQRAWLTQTMDAEREQRAAVGHTSLTRSLRSGRVWLLCTIYFLNTLVTYGIYLWLPKMLTEAAGGRQSFGLSVLTSIPFVAALIAMFLVGRHSDRTGERKFHVAACAMTAATGLVLAVLFRNNLWLVVLSFTLSQIGQRSVQGVFWAIPPIFLGGTAAAGCIGLINALGNLGGYVGPSVMGALRQASGTYSQGLLILALALVVETAIVVSLRLPKRDASARS